jgi:hypothetical protein
MPIAAKISEKVRDVAVALLPVSTRDWIRAQQRRLGLQAVPVGSVTFGSLDRLDPIRRDLRQGP